MLSSRASEPSPTGRLPRSPTPNPQYLPGAPADRLQQHAENPASAKPQLDLDYAATEKRIAGLVGNANTLDTAASEKLRNETVGCRLRLQRLSMTKGFDDATKTQIAASLKLTKKRAISGGHKILDDGHPTIKEHNEFFGRVEKYWKSMTMPLSSAYTEEVSTEGGTRLLRRDQAEEFQNRMLAFKSEGETLQHKLLADRSGILDDARDMLGERFNEKNYPKEFVIGIYWGFPNVDVPSYLATMAPNAFEHERQLVAKRFEDTYELATMTMMQEFKAVMQSWVDALGPVVRIYPPESHELRSLHGAEVFKSAGHDDDETIPLGSVKLLLRFKEDGKTGLQEKEIGPLTQTQYADLQPRESVGEKRTFRDSTIDNLAELVAKFRRMGDAISSPPELNACVKELEDRLAKCRNTAETARELRDSRIFRTETHKTLKKLSQSVENQIETFRKSRLRIDRA